MNIRKSKNEDIKEIMNIIKEAQSYFYNQGINQWQDGYPNDEQIAHDITLGHSYVIEDDHIVGTMYFAIEDDENYGVIDGQWLTDSKPYGVIHRIAVSDGVKGQGVAGLLLEYAVNYCKENNIDSIRVDTHSDNQSMQRYLLKNGFVYCGGITLKRSGDPRIGFEKLISH